LKGKGGVGITTGGGSTTTGAAGASSTTTGLGGGGAECDPAFLDFPFERDPSCFEEEEGEEDSGDELSCLTPSGNISYTLFPVTR
jgi:hypothetical protein